MRIREMLDQHDPGQEMGELADGFEDPAVNAATARFQKHFKIDRELQKKIKR